MKKNKFEEMYIDAIKKLLNEKPAIELIDNEFIIENFELLEKAIEEKANEDVQYYLLEKCKPC